MQKQLEEEKQVTEQKILESKKQFRDFNVNKLFITLNSLTQRKTRQHRTQAFDQIQLYSSKVKLIVDKSTRQRLFRQKADVLRGWRLANAEDRRQRELEEIEMHERLLMQIEQHAISKLAQKLKLKVMKILRKNVQLCQDQKQIELEHNQRKAQIDNFFQNLKRKVETEKTQQAQDA